MGKNSIPYGEYKFWAEKAQLDAYSEDEWSVVEDDGKFEIINRLKGIFSKWEEYQKTQKVSLVFQIYQECEFFCQYPLFLKEERTQEEERKEYLNLHKKLVSVCKEAEVVPVQISKDVDFLDHQISQLESIAERRKNYQKTKNPKFAFDAYMFSFRCGHNIPTWIARWIFEAFHKYEKAFGKADLGRLLGFENPHHTVFELEKIEEKNLDNLWKIAVVKSLLSVDDNFACLVVHTAEKADDWDSLDTIKKNFKSYKNKKWRENKNFASEVFGDDEISKIEFLMEYLPDEKYEVEGKYHKVKKNRKNDGTCDYVSAEEIKQIRKKIQAAIADLLPDIPPLSL